MLTILGVAALISAVSGLLAWRCGLLPWVLGIILALLLLALLLFTLLLVALLLRGVVVLLVHGVLRVRGGGRNGRRWRKNVPRDRRVAVGKYG
jgi:hypothetical protein